MAIDALPVLRVLCVDDNKDVADSTADLFRIAGFESRACYDGLSAVTAFHEFSPGVCLIDLNMKGGMDGDELANHLQAEAAGCAVLFVAVTARDDPASRLRTSNAGFDLHLVKPVDPRDLLQIVDELWRLGATRCRRWNCDTPMSPAVLPAVSYRDVRRW